MNLKIHRSIFQGALAAVVVGSGLLIYSANLGAAGADCYRKEFQTEMYREACLKGGQSEAKKQGKKFMKKARKLDRSIRNCKSCHSSLKPRYDLKADGLQKYNELLPKIRVR